VFVLFTHSGINSPLGDTNAIKLLKQIGQIR